MTITSIHLLDIVISATEPIKIGAAATEYDIRAYMKTINLDYLWTLGAAIIAAGFCFGIAKNAFAIMTGKHADFYSCFMKYIIILCLFSGGSKFFGQFTNILVANSGVKKSDLLDKYTRKNIDWTRSVMSPNDLDLCTNTPNLSECMKDPVAYNKANPGTAGATTGKEGMIDTVKNFPRYINMAFATLLSTIVNWVIAAIMLLAFCLVYMLKIIIIDLAQPIYLTFYLMSFLFTVSFAAFGKLEPAIIKYLQNIISVSLWPALYYAFLLIVGDSAANSMQEFYQKMTFNDAQQVSSFTVNRNIFVYIMTMGWESFAVLFKTAAHIVILLWGTCKIPAWSDKIVKSEAMGDMASGMAMTFGSAMASFAGGFAGGATGAAGGFGSNISRAVGSAAGQLSSIGAKGLSETLKGAGGGGLRAVSRRTMENPGGGVSENGSPMYSQKDANTLVGELSSIGTPEAQNLAQTLGGKLKKEIPNYGNKDKAFTSGDAQKSSEAQAKYGAMKNNAYHGVGVTAAEFLKSHYNLNKSNKRGI